MVWFSETHFNSSSQIWVITLLWQKWKFDLVVPSILLYIFMQVWVWDHFGWDLQDTSVKLSNQAHSCTIRLYPHFFLCPHLLICFIFRLVELCPNKCFVNWQPLSFYTNLSGSTKDITQLLHLHWQSQSLWLKTDTQVPIVDMSDIQALIPKLSPIAHPSVQVNVWDVHKQANLVLFVFVRDLEGLSCTDHGLHWGEDVLVDQFGEALLILICVAWAVDYSHLLDEGALATLSST